MDLSSTEVRQILISLFSVISPHLILSPTLIIILQFRNKRTADRGRQLGNFVPGPTLIGVPRQGLQQYHKCPYRSQGIYFHNAFVNQLNNIVAADVDIPFTSHQSCQLLFCKLRCTTPCIKVAPLAFIYDPASGFYTNIYGACKKYSNRTVTLIQSSSAIDKLLKLLSHSIP